MPLKFWNWQKKFQERHKSDHRSTQPAAGEKKWFLGEPIGKGDFNFPFFAMFTSSQDDMRQWAEMGAHQRMLAAEMVHKKLKIKLHIFDS